MRKRGLRAVLVAFIATRAASFVAIELGARRTHPRFAGAWERRDSDLLQGPAPSKLLEPLVRWDALFYLALAREGYPPARESIVYHAGFFPLYPLAVRAVAQLGLDDFVAALLVSNAAALAAAVALLRWAGLRAALLLLAMPGAHFLSLPYAEGLFSLLLVLSLSALESQRPFHAAIAGALATAARPPGVVVPFVLAIEALRRRSLRWLLASGLSCAGLAAFSAYCWQRYGCAIYWAQTRPDVHARGGPLLGPLRAIAAFDVDPDYYAVAIASLAGLWLAWRKAPAPRWLAGAFLFWLPLTTGSMKGLVRYASANVPLLAAAARRIPTRSFRALLASSFALGLVEAFLYGKGMGHN